MISLITKVQIKPQFLSAPLWALARSCMYVSHNTNIMLDQLPLWDDEPFLAVGRFFPAGFIRLLHNVNLFYNFAQGFITRSTKESRIDQENTLTFYVW